MFARNLVCVALGVIGATNCSCEKNRGKVDSQEVSPPTTPTPATKATEQTREDLNAEEKEDGMPLFERFLGANCALSLRGETWCPEEKGKTYRKVRFNGRIDQVVSTASPLKYILSNEGQVYLLGTFNSETDINNSLDYQVPHPVPGLSSVREMAVAGGVLFAVTRDGALLRWTLTEERDDLHGAARIVQSPPTRALSGTIRRIFGGHALCVEEAEKLWCTANVDSLEPYGRFTPPLDGSELVDAVLGTHTCFATRDRAYCYSRWVNTKERRQPMGSYQLDVSVRKLGQSTRALLDANGDVYRWHAPPFGGTIDKSLPDPELIHVEHLGKVRDVQGSLCTIEVNGELACRTDGDWWTEPTIRPKFVEHAAPPQVDKSGNSNEPGSEK